MLLPEPLAPEISVALALRQLDPRILQQRLAVRQRQGQRLGGDVLTSGLGHDVGGRLWLFVGRRLQALQTIHHRPQLGKRRVVVDEERERGLHLAESGRRLHHYAERYGSCEEAWRSHHGRGK